MMKFNKKSGNFLSSSGGGINPLPQHMKVGWKPTPHRRSQAFSLTMAKRLLA
jgi:hypothetical protein